MAALLFRTRITAILLLLIAASALSVTLSRGFVLSDPRPAGLAIIIIAFVKARFVLLDFMELRGAPPAMRIAAETWTVLVCAALCGLYW